MSGYTQEINIIFQHYTLCMPCLKCFNRLEEHLAACEELSDEVLVELSICSELQMICTCSSSCQCHSIISFFIKSRMVNWPFSCQVTQVILKKAIKWMSFNISMPKLQSITNRFGYRRPMVFLVVIHIHIRIPTKYTADESCFVWLTTTTNSNRIQHYNLCLLALWYNRQMDLGSNWLAMSGHITRLQHAACAS